MIKKTVLVIHRWLGLTTGLVVLILSITGCLFVFQKEFTNWMRKDIMYVENQLPERLTIDQMLKNTADALEVDRLSYGMVTYRNPYQAWSAFSYIPEADSWTYFGSIADYRTVYMDPYTGEPIKVVNEEEDFFQIIKGIHWSLLLSTPIGQPIVVWSTVIFLVLLVSGMILWWPKKWNQLGRDKSFKVKFGAKWRRINYDLHNVLGFYVLVLALIVGITGLYWAFPTVKKSLYFLGTGKFQLPGTSAVEVESILPESSVEGSPYEVAYKKAWQEFPEAYSIAFTAPLDSSGTITAVIRGDGYTYYEKSEMKFDQYSGEVLHVDAYQEKNTGEKLLAMNYDIHVGAIWGIPGKIIAFLISLVCGSLPVTGFIIWFDKKRRK